MVNTPVGFGHKDPYWSQMSLQTFNEVRHTSALALWIASSTTTRWHFWESGSQCHTILVFWVLAWGLKYKKIIE